MSSRKRRIPPLAINLGVLLLSSILGLLVFELSLRGLAYAESRETLERALERKLEVPAGSKARLVDMIRLSEHPRLIYELQPQLDVYFKRQRVKTNRDGFRDRDYSVAKSPGAKRILGIGDSIMFGWGVAQEENYLALLEGQLAERFPATPWEVINTAVPGYNTVMETAALKAHGLRFEPDLVIIGFCNNDFDLPNFISQNDDYSRWDRSFLVDFVARRLAGRPDEKEGEEDDDGDFGLQTVFGESGRDPAKVPQRYRDMMGWEAFERALRDLHALSEQHGFEVLNVFFGVGQGTEKIRAIELSSQLGFHVVDLAEVLRDYMRQHGIRSYRGSELTLSRNDPHPSPIGHRICAAELLRYLEEQRLATSDPA